MSQQRLNLARRPFVDSRPANALVGFCLLVTLALCLWTGAPWVLLGFAAVETGFGLWTARALRVSDGGSGRPA